MSETKQDSGGMTIISLEAENVKRLKAVAIKPNAKGATVIGGNNGAGKTSVLDSIMYALGGKGVVQAKPVREGQKQATVALTTSTGYLVEKKFKADGSEYLKITDPSGAMVKSPQTMLNGLIGEISFDPIAFSRLDGKKQGEMVRRLAGLNFDTLNEKRAAYYAQRTDVNRDVKSLRANLDKFPEFSDAPERVDVSLLMKELSQVEESRRNVEQHRQNLREVEAGIKRMNEEVSDIDNQIAVLQERRALKVRTAAELEGKLASARQIVLEMEAGVKDAEPIKTKIAEASEINSRADLYERRVEAEAQWKNRAKESDELTGKIEKIDDLKKEMLAKAKFPVDGLGFDDEGALLLNGVPFEQASQAEQLRTCVAIGIALNPTLRLLLIRDGSLLDDSNLQLVHDMCAAADFQVIIERVGHGEECSVIIEDGSVLAN